MTDEKIGLPCPAAFWAGWSLDVPGSEFQKD